MSQTTGPSIARRSTTKYSYKTKIWLDSRVHHHCPTIDNNHKSGEFNEENQKKSRETKAGKDHRNISHICTFLSVSIEENGECVIKIHWLLPPLSPNESCVSTKHIRKYMKRLTVVIIKITLYWASRLISPNGWNLIGSGSASRL